MVNRLRRRLGGSHGGVDPRSVERSAREQHAAPGHRGFERADAGQVLWLEDRQRIGRIRFSYERLPGVWLWGVSVHLPGGLQPMGSAPDINTAKSEFREAWKALKARTPPEQLAAAYKAMNIRGDD